MAIDLELACFDRVFQQVVGRLLVRVPLFPDHFLVLTGVGDILVIVPDHVWSRLGGRKRAAVDTLSNIFASTVGICMTSVNVI